MEFHGYDGANHAFQNFKNPDRYHEHAATDSWDRTLKFLADKLGYSARFSRQKRVAIDFKCPRVWLATGTTKRIDGGTSCNGFEARHFEHPLPACARQASGDSSRPEIDVAYRGLRYWFPVGNIREL